MDQTLQTRGCAGLLRQRDQPGREKADVICNFRANLSLASQSATLSPKHFCPKCCVYLKLRDSNRSQRPRQLDQWPARAL
jgi:hypothetical protein